MKKEVNELVNKANYYCTDSQSVANLVSWPFGQSPPSSQLQSNLGWHINAKQINRNMAQIFVVVIANPQTHPCAFINNTYVCVYVWRKSGIDRIQF